MTQTALEIKQAFRAWLETSPELTYYSYDGTANPGIPETVHSFTNLVFYLEDSAPLDEDGHRHLEVPGVEGLVYLAETQGGEGEGDYAHAILRIVSAMGHDRYFMLDGYHRSYDGTYYDSGFSEVKKIQKVVDAWDNV